jgi:hypothetical protein
MGEIPDFVTIDVACVTKFHQDIADVLFFYNVNSFIQNLCSVHCYLERPTPESIQGSE